MNTEKLLPLLREEISGVRAREYVANITRFHRIQASPGFHEAATYVYNELKKSGIEVELWKFKSDGKKKYFEFTSPIGWDVEEGYLEIIEPKCQKIADFSKIPTSIVAHSNSTPEDGITAEVVYVGKGETGKDYEGKDVKGKFVLAYGAPRRVHKEAVVKRGAVGVILFRKMFDAPDAVPYRGFWPTADEIKNLGVGFSISLRQAEQLISRLEKGEKIKVKGYIKARFFDSWLEVVTGVIRGEKRPEEEVLLIAHLCHPKPSANDNASGSGLLIEIAKTLKRLIDRGKIPKPKRTLRFMWVPEYYGTVAVVSEKMERLGKIVSVINLDMVGENQNLCGSTITITETPLSLPSFLPFLLEDFIEEEAKRGMKQFGATDALYSLRFKGTAYSYGSDHDVFVNVDLRVPAAAIICWPDKFYHSSEDTIDKVDPKVLEKIGVAAACTALICVNPDSEYALRLVSRTLRETLMKLKRLEEKALMSKDKHELFLLYRSASILKEWGHHAASSLLLVFEGETLERLVNESIFEIDEVVLRTENKIRMIAKFQGYDIEKYELSGKEKEAQKIYPVKKFKGLLPSRILTEQKNEEKNLFYLEKMEKEDILMSQIPEIINLMDGKRSIFDIYLMLFAEYGKANLEDIKHVCDDLKDLKLIDYQNTH
ncbi:MAG: DUF4910 domain-containing protein [Candidatus Baldrarchaeia archaeon]